MPRHGSVRGLSRVNLNHLHYFWAVARHGSVTAASRELGVSQPTVSAQVQSLEEELDELLFLRTGRRMELTPAGRVVAQHAEEMFRIGREMVRTLEAGAAGGPSTLNVGLTDGVPKIIVRGLLGPCLQQFEALRIVVLMGRFDQLLAELASSRFDVLITDAPAPGEAGSRIASYDVGDSPVDLCAAAPLARRLRKGFPGSLDGAPVVLPAASGPIRSAVDQWLSSNAIRPRIVIEAEDRSMVNHFGQIGIGAVPVASVIGAEVRRQFNMERIGPLRGVREKYYALAIRREAMHPAVETVCEQARKRFRSGERG